MHSKRIFVNHHCTSTADAFPLSLTGTDSIPPRTASPRMSATFNSTARATNAHPPPRGSYLGSSSSLLGGTLASSLYLSTSPRTTATAFTPGASNPFTTTRSRLAHSQAAIAERRAVTAAAAQHEKARREQLAKETGKDPNDPSLALPFQGMVSMGGDDGGDDGSARQKLPSIAMGNRRSSPSTASSPQRFTHDQQQTIMTRLLAQHLRSRTHFTDASVQVQRRIEAMVDVDPRTLVPLDQALSSQSHNRNDTAMMTMAQKKARDAERAARDEAFRRKMIKKRHLEYVNKGEGGPDVKEWLWGKPLLDEGGGGEENAHDGEDTTNHNLDNGSMSGSIQSTHARNNTTNNRSPSQQQQQRGGGGGGGGSSSRGSSPHHPLSQKGRQSKSPTRLGSGGGGFSSKGDAVEPLTAKSLEEMAEHRRKRQKQRRSRKRRVLEEIKEELEERKRQRRAKRQQQRCERAAALGVREADLAANDADDSSDGDDDEARRHREEDAPLLELIRIQEQEDALGSSVSDDGDDYTSSDSEQMEDEAFALSMLMKGGGGGGGGVAHQRNPMRPVKSDVEAKREEIREIRRAIKRYGRGLTTKRPNAAGGGGAGGGPTEALAALKAARALVEDVERMKRLEEAAREQYAAVASGDGEDDTEDHEHLVLISGDATPTTNALSGHGSDVEEGEEKGGKGDQQTIAAANGSTVVNEGGAAAADVSVTTTPPPPQLGESLPPIRSMEGSRRPGDGRASTALSSGLGAAATRASSAAVSTAVNSAVLLNGSKREGTGYVPPEEVLRTQYDASHQRLYAESVGRGSYVPMPLPPPFDGLSVSSITEAVCADACDIILSTESIMRTVTESLRRQRRTASLDADIERANHATLRSVLWMTEASQHVDRLIKGLGSMSATAFDEVVLRRRELVAKHDTIDQQERQLDRQRDETLQLGKLKEELVRELRLKKALLDIHTATSPPPPPPSSMNNNGTSGGGAAGWARTPSASSQQQHSNSTLPSKRAHSNGDIVVTSPDGAGGWGSDPFARLTAPRPAPPSAAATATAAGEEIPPPINTYTDLLSDPKLAQQSLTRLRQLLGKWSVMAGNATAKGGGGNAAGLTGAQQQAALNPLAMLFAKNKAKQSDALQSGSGGRGGGAAAAAGHAPRPPLAGSQSPKQRQPQPPLRAVEVALEALTQEVISRQAMVALVEELLPLTKAAGC